MAQLTLKGAREHNLADLDLVLELGRFVAFTGVSGSGKTSLAFDTLHAEGQRRYLRALAVHHRSLATTLPRPDVDRIDGLPPTIALAQHGGLAASGSTVASWTECGEVLGIVFGRAGALHCPVCGRPVHPKSHDEMVDGLAANPPGTRLTLEAPLWATSPGDVLDEVQRAGFSRIRVDGEMQRLDEVRSVAAGAEVRVVVDRVRWAEDRRDRLHDAIRLTARTGRGVVVAVVGEEVHTFVDRPFCAPCGLTLPALHPRLFSTSSAEGACRHCAGRGSEDHTTACGHCDGSGLSDAARAVRWRGWSLPELLARSAEALAELQQLIDLGPVEAVALPDLDRRLTLLTSLGLGDLALDRRVATLSSGERQRVRLVRHVASPLAGVLYILDEPAAQLDPVNARRVAALVRGLVNDGNSVVVVTPRSEIIDAADEVLDFGPGPGARGGEIVFRGTPSELAESGTTTGLWLARSVTLPRRQRPSSSVRRVRAEGLVVDGRSVDVALPMGRIAAIVGPSGAGKTRLLEAMAAVLSLPTKNGERTAPPVAGLSGHDVFERVLSVDRSAARSTRSMPATYTGLWGVLRELLAATREAQIRGLGASMFSLNVKGGRCEACLGTGARRIELQLLPSVEVVCDVCDGRRFSGDVLAVRWKGHDAYQLLELSVDAARKLLAGHPRMELILRAMDEVGLGYLPIGRPTASLSGGEARRLRLARELARRKRVANSLFLLDQPTVGLHASDVAVLLGALRSMVDAGATVWLATHDADLARACDELVVLERDGRIRFEGPVENLGDELLVLGG